MKRIVYLDRAGLPERFNVPKPSLEHEWVDYAASLPEQVIERSKSADVLVSNKVVIGEDVLLACPTVKHIAVSATGYNVIDIEACERHGVSVSNIPSYAAATVSEHVIASALCLRRELQQYRQQVIEGAWQQSDTFCLFDKPINNLESTTFGVIGFGELGSATANKAHALGMNVIFNSRSKHDCDFAQQVGLQQVIEQSDILSIHCSLTPQTHNLISKAELNTMQDHAILINTARGGIVDEAAVVDAINSSEIAGVAFDVLAEEPPKSDSPLLQIAKLSNVLITPHIAWASEQAMQGLAKLLGENINAFISGCPQNIVTNPTNKTPTPK